MTDKPENPQAFPNGPETSEQYGEYGMTLRDYFAGKALEGMCANPELLGSNEADFAYAAYNRADAMLKARAE